MARQLHPLLQPYVPSSSDPFDALKAAHLLNRAAFGGKPEELETVMELGPSKAIDALLDFPDASADEQSKTDVPDLSAVGDGYPRTFVERRKLLLGKTQEERQMINNQLMAKNRDAMTETMKWWLKRMQSGAYPLQEKLTFFWHGHFTTSARDERSAGAMWQQNETLRRNAAGNFRAFVKQISRDPAMLDYLNNQQNRKAHPNENYARELMELFTLGIGNYTEDDIKEAARAFTGWSHDGEDFVFRRFEHDYGIKNFFGRTGNFDGDDVIDIILQKDACAAYIANRLLAFFVMEEPDAPVCQSLGRLLRESNYDLRPVLATMFTSKLFYSPKVIGAQIKSPVQLVIGTQRLLDVSPPNPMQLVVAMQQMGQVPFGPPNVKGWPGGRSWINTATLLVRYNTAVWLAGGGTPVQGGPGPAARFVELRGANRANRANQRGRGPLGPMFNPQATARSAEDLVDTWVARLIQRPIAPQRRQTLIEAVGDRYQSESMTKKVIQLLVALPEYQLC
jgi:uncharacterized protein (DUF1800 family)